MNKKQQKDSITIAYIAAAVIIFLTMTLLGVSVFLKINSIVVSGMSIYTPEQVADASGLARGDNLLFLSRKNVQQNILGQLHYMRSVEVDRDFPDILNIRVTESSPIAYIPFAGDAIVIDSSGRILEIVPSITGTSVQVLGVNLLTILGVPISEAKPGGMPVIVAGSEPSFKAVQDILAAMEREGIIKDISYLDVSGITNISFGYMELYRVRIGGLSNFQPKISGLTSMVTSIQEEGSSNVSGTIDMTDPGGYYKFIPDQ